jgi:hypothetical protein
LFAICITACMFLIFYIVISFYVLFFSETFKLSLPFTQILCIFFGIPYGSQFTFQDYNTLIWIYTHLASITYKKNLLLHS